VVPLGQLANNYRLEIYAINCNNTPSISSKSEISENFNIEATSQSDGILIKIKNTSELANSSYQLHTNYDSQGFLPWGNIFRTDSYQLIPDQCFSRLDLYIEDLACGKISDTVTVSRNTAALNISYDIKCNVLSWESEISDTSNNVPVKYRIYRSYDATNFEIVDSVIGVKNYCIQEDNCGRVTLYIIENTECQTFSNTRTVNGTVQTINDSIVEMGNVLSAVETNAGYQWYSCSRAEKLAGETNQTFIPKDTGSYAVIVRKFNCNDTSRCILIDAVGIAEIAQEKYFTIFPNPTDGSFQISTEAAQQLNFRLFSLSGQEVALTRYGQPGSYQVVTETKPGIYFLEILNQLGDIAVEKLLVK
jgi:hypothetical protein